MYPYLPGIGIHSCTSIEQDAFQAKCGCPSINFFAASRFSACKTEYPITFFPLFVLLPSGERATPLPRGVPMSTNLSPQFFAQVIQASIPFAISSGLDFDGSHPSIEPWYNTINFFIWFLFVGARLHLFFAYSWQFSVSLFLFGETGKFYLSNTN